MGCRIGGAKARKQSTVFKVRFGRILQLNSPEFANEEAYIVFANVGLL